MHDRERTEIYDLIEAKMDVTQFLDFLDISFAEVLDKFWLEILNNEDALWSELG